MKAIVIHEYGPPDVLRYQDFPDPVPRDGEIRIKVHAATVNRVLDVSLRAGREQYRGPVLPLIPGVDCAGIVDAVGPHVSRWHVGDRISAAGIMPLQICAEDGSGYDGPQGMMGIKRQGGFAELVAVPACAGVAIPQNLDFHRAAVVMRHVPTAWNLLMHVAELKYGETVLIMGAGGNLGSIGIQIAKNVIGAHVIAAAGSEERATLGKKLGADHAINYKSEDFVAEVKNVTSGAGANVILDMVGGDYIDRNYEAAAVEGRIVQIAFLSGTPKATANFAKLMVKRLTHTGSTLRPRSNADKAAMVAAIEAKVMPLLAEGRIKPLMDSTFPLEKAADAHRRMETSEHIGKIVLLA